MEGDGAGGRGSLCTLCIYLFYGCLASRMPAVAFYGPLNVLFAFAHSTFCAFSSLPLLLLKCSEMKCKFVWGPTQSCLTCSISFDIIVVAAHLGQLCDCDLLIGRRIGIIHLTIENTLHFSRDSLRDSCRAEWRNTSVRLTQRKTCRKFRSATTQHIIM